MIISPQRLLTWIAFGKINTTPMYERKVSPPHVRPDSTKDSSWWLNQPIWKILVKLDHFPSRGKNKIFETTTQNLRAKLIQWTNQTAPNTPSKAYIFLFIPSLRQPRQSPASTNPPIAIPMARCLLLPCTQSLAQYQLRLVVDPVLFARGFRCKLLLWESTPLKINGWNIIPWRFGSDHVLF